MTLLQNKRNRNERLDVVLNISKRLKKFPKATYIKTEMDPYIDLYNSDYNAILRLKQIFKEYINQDDKLPELLVGMSGKIVFHEIERRIEYRLPINKRNEPLFVLRCL